MTTMRRLAFLAMAHDHTGSPSGKGQGTARESVVLAFETAEAFVKRARTTATPVMVGGAYEKRLAGVMGVVATGVVAEMSAGRMRICDGKDGQQESAFSPIPVHHTRYMQGKRAARAQPPYRDRQRLAPAIWRQGKGDVERAVRVAGGGNGVFRGGDGRVDELREGRGHGEASLALSPHVPRTCCSEPVAH